MFGEERWQMAARDAEPLARLLDLKPGARVLDLCCGPGRFSIELARRGFKVTGVDRTVLYLNEARKRARQQKLDVEFVRQDMRRFVRTKAFDACINMCTSIGYFEDPADDLKVCRNVHRSLRPGGRFLVQTGGKEWLAREFRSRDWREEAGAFILEERKVMPGWTGIENRWVIIQKGKAREFRFSLRLYSSGEISDLLTRAGFKKVDIYGGVDGAPYDDTSRWLVAVGRK
jgi:SAM-dependent methyltransferase